MIGSLANKEDTMKRLAQLSKKIREVMEVLASFNGGGRVEDDAMLSKR